MWTPHCWGAGGYIGNEAYAVLLPQSIKDGLSIVHFEMVNMVVSLRVWGQKLSNAHVLVHCDNAAVVSIVNLQSTKDAFLAACMRSLWLITAEYNIVLRAIHIRGKDNSIADVLSRWFEPTTSYSAKKLLLDNFGWQQVRPAMFILDWCI